MRLHKKHPGFTLVEILLVVILLALLASVVIAQFGHSTTSSKRTALTDQLRALRSQIELYRAQHGDQPPPLAGSDWSALTTQTTFVGKNCGPYLHGPPTNMLNGFSDLAVVTATVSFGDAVATPNCGFVYNSDTGQIWATNRTGDKVFNEYDLDDPNN